MNAVREVLRCLQNSRDREKTFLERFGLSLNRDFPRGNTVAQVQNETDQCNV